MSQVLSQLQKGHIRNDSVNDNPGILNENVEIFFKILCKEFKQDTNKDLNMI